MKARTLVPRFILGVCYALLSCRATGADAWLATVGISLDPPDGSQQVVSFAFKPVRSAEYNQLIFECIYRQEIPWTDERGRAVKKIIEPVTFTFRRADVKLVAELDFFCNFRAPYGYEKLTQDFGPNTFAKDGAPITIDRVRISGEIGGKRVWQHEFKASGTHTVVEPPPPPPPAPKPKNTTFGEVDLD
jgi:hypothetical protein